MRNNAKCHPDRLAHGQGYCQSCYTALRMKRLLPTTARMGSSPMAICHPDRPHCAKGLCRSCYMKPYLNKYSYHRMERIIPGTEKCSMCGRADWEPGRWSILRKGLCWNCRNEATRRLVISHYSEGQNCCACCGEYRYAFLTIDHLIPTWQGKRPHNEGGDALARRLIKNKFPLGFRILCYNCNISRSHGRVCPHEKERVADRVLEETVQQLDGISGGGK